MKKITKCDLSALETQFLTVKKEELKKILGGLGEIDLGTCVYGCMSFLTDYFNEVESYFTDASSYSGYTSASYNTNLNGYIAAYAGQYYSGENYGYGMYKASVYGVSSAYFESFLGQYFDYSSSDPMCTTTDNPCLAAYNDSTGQGHVVALLRYDSSANAYLAYDSDGTGGLVQIPADTQFTHCFSICGFKTDNDQ
jgi:hypothetical protein